MSRKGNCWDNAVAEAFFSSLKKERITKLIYKTRELQSRTLRTTSARSTIPRGGTAISVASVRSNSKRLTTQRR